VEHAGRAYDQADLFGPIKSALDAKFGKSEWILDTAGTSPYFEPRSHPEKGLDEAEVRRVAAKAAAAVPTVLRVYTGDQLQSGGAE